MLKKKDLSEKELVEACVANDRRAQERLFRKFFPGMMRMCMRYTDDKGVAMEIVNAGFLRVFKKLHTFSFSGSLEGWIRRLVFHSLSDHFKKQTKPVHFLSLEDRDAPHESSALDHLFWEDIIKLVDFLPAASKEVFWLYAIEGYSHAEIAERANISVGTSKWHLSNARSKLKTLILQTNNKTNYAG